MFAIAVALVGQAATARTPPLAVQDVFGRDLSEVGVTLVDWEGRIANPAIRLRLVPSPRLYLPARVKLTANGDRLMFNLWSEVGPDGPSKTIYLEPRTRSVPFSMSIFPDTDGLDETYTLTLEVTDANESTSKVEVPLRVIDQDRPDRPSDFQIHIDAGHDKSQFFEDEKVRAIFRTAADDWAYFIDSRSFDTVPAGAEKSYIYDATGFASGFEVTNSQAYQGFLMYAVGVTGKERRSGAVASDRGGVQTVGGRRTGLRRSGTVAMETSGNYNGRGWLFLLPDQEWWRAGNMAFLVNDFYSIVRHEMGHSLAFHRVHPAFESRLADRVFNDQTLRRYAEGELRIGDVEHFTDSIDPVSRVGAFGNEYGGEMPRKRWLVTKFDLLVLQAIGYRLRDTSPFARLNFEVSPTPVKIVAGTDVDLDLKPSGGIPTYEFRVFEGQLPQGLVLDSWTGRISGSTRALGDRTVTIQLRDNDPTRSPVLKSLKLTVVGSEAR